MLSSLENSKDQIEFEKDTFSDFVSSASKLYQVKFTSLLPFFIVIISLSLFIIFINIMYFCFTV